MKAVGFVGWVAVWLWTSIPSQAETWAVTDSPTQEPLIGVGYENGLYLAVGWQYTILTSSNGWNWSAKSFIPPRTKPLSCVAYGSGTYVIGSPSIELIQTSTDGVHWTSRVSTIGVEGVYGLTYGYGQFVAVGNGDNGSESSSIAYVLWSTNGVDWTSRNSNGGGLPATNRLYSVAAGIGVDGQNTASPTFVAVGDHGTIMTSGNGLDWVLRVSGTTSPLRAVIFHKGRFLAGGDSGVILSSSDGVEWSAAAPTSFDVRGFASSGTSLVAVGAYSGSGRLQSSSDGLSWPGQSLVVSQPLNAVEYAAGSFVAVGDGGLVLQSMAGSSPLLAFGRSGNAVVLSWVGDYELMQSSNPAGPYSAIPGAASPFTNAPAGAQGYFRLRSLTP